MRNIKCAGTRKGLWRAVIIGSTRRSGVAIKGLQAWRPQVVARRIATRARSWTDRTSGQLGGALPILLSFITQHFQEQIHCGRVRKTPAAGFGAVKHCFVGSSSACIEDGRAGGGDADCLQNAEGVSGLRRKS